MDPLNIAKLRRSNGLNTDIHIDDLDIGECIQVRDSLPKDKISC